MKKVSLKKVKIKKKPLHKVRVKKHPPKKKVGGRKLKSTSKSPRRKADTSTPTVEVYGKKFEYKRESSSDAGNSRVGGLNMSNFNRIRPRIDFWKREEYYLTVGRVQNVTESFVLNLINREWYYDAGDEDSTVNDAAVDLMEAWEEKINISAFIAKMVRNWIINGVHIISPVDWLPVQLQTLTAKKRDKKGDTEFYYQVINGVEKALPAKDFLELPYIEFDREPWPVGMFDSLMNRDYIDIDGRDPRASLELYRQALQDNMKIHHKYASPRVIYWAEGVSKETLDNDIIPVIEGMMPGDRAAFNAKIEITQETVDGNARFIEHVNKIIDEIDTGLQSSSNRLITEPSAMADAREAGAQDDDRTLGIMERVRLVMNKEVIPRVTGLTAGEVIFKWGAKDSFDLELPDPIKDALKLKLIFPEQALVMLQEQWHWKIPTLEEAMEKLGGAALPQPDPEPEKPGETKKDKTPEDKKNEPPLPTTEMKVHNEKMTNERLELEKKIKNEKLIFYNELGRKLKEI